MIPSMMNTHRQAAMPFVPLRPANTALCRYPEIMVPTYAAQAKMAVLFPSSVFLYHDPRTYWIPTKVEASRKPTKKRMG